MKLCFLGRIGLRAQEAVTRITESNHRRWWANGREIVCATSATKSQAASHPRPSSMPCRWSKVLAAIAFKDVGPRAPFQNPGTLTLIIVVRDRVPGLFSKHQRGGLSHFFRDIAARSLAPRVKLSYAPWSTNIVRIVICTRASA